MSLSAILNTAASALSVNQQALRTTSNNIANVNTPGYVRQRVDLQAAVIGTQSNGVEIAGIARMADRFLEAASWSAGADFAKYDALSTYYDRFDTLLGDPNDNASIPGKLDQVYSSLTSLALEPTAAGNRQAALAAIESFSRTVSDMATQIQDLRSEVSGQITDAVGEINSVLDRIAKLNPQIVSAKVMGSDAATLEEQRSQALHDLSKLIDIQVSTGADGAVRVSTTKGIPLVDIAAHRLEYNPPGTVTSGTQFDPISVYSVDPKTGAVSAVGQALDSGLSSGELRGLLDMRDTVLPEFGRELGNFARAAVDEFNAVHNASTAYPAPNSLTGAQTGFLASDVQGFTGKAQFAVTDGSGNLVNSVTIDFDSYGPGATLATVIADVNAGLGGAGTLALTDGVMSFSAADPANGVVIAQDEAAPSERGGRGFSHFFGMNDLLTSSTPSHYDTGVTAGQNHNLVAGGTLDLKLRAPDGETVVDYTYTVGGTTFGDIVNGLNASPLGGYMTFSLGSDGQLVSTPKAGGEAYRLYAGSDTTNRGGTGVTLSRFFGMGEANAADSASNVGLAKAIAADNRRLALGRFEPTGDPAITVGDGRGAQMMADLQAKQVSFGAVGQLDSMRVTLGQYGAAFLSNTAQAGTTAQTRRGDAEALSVAVDEKLSNATGVNLDEELSNLLIYQNAYNAAARIITTAQQMMDTLIGMMR